MRSGLVLFAALPGQPYVGFQQFSGYVTVDDKKHKSLFYYFVESETDPTSKPLVLWLHGGLGCSSVEVGAFSKNGPFRPNGEFLIKNDLEQRQTCCIWRHQLKWGSLMLRVAPHI